MSMFPQPGAQKSWELEYGADDRSVSKFFNVVYAWMAVGLAVTAAVAWYVSHTPSLMKMFFGNPMVAIACALGAFGIAIGVQRSFRSINANVATALFLLYAALIGAMISYIFVIYPAKTLASAFVVTGGTFAGMSIYGMVTRRDLTRIGGILIMCFWGLLLASIVNIFVASNALDWLITYGILAIFIGITAYETQQLKAMATEFGHNTEMAARYAIYGSLVLYISFINLFMSILRIMGDRR
ncbi:MAG: ybhL [Phycisphaerales bacterium]|nr:ybhL [Phycisphaerales bacterium]